MKKLITIILALIMTLYSEISHGADELHVTAEKPPQPAITITVEQVIRRKRKDRRNGVLRRGDGGKNKWRSIKERSVLS